MADLRNDVCCSCVKIFFSVEIPHKCNATTNSRLFFNWIFYSNKKILDLLETGKRIQTCRRPEISDPIGHKMVTVEHVSIYFDGWP